MKPDDEHPEAHQPQSNDARGDDTDASPVSGSVSRDLARELTGDLPCISCGYNLRSMSVLGVCPECATPVRATILARVDPYAGVLRPIPLPRLVAAGLLLWSLGGLAAALLTWGLRGADAYEVLVRTQIASARFVEVALIALALSAFGAALALVSPHRGIPWRHRLFALGGVFAYIPLAFAYWQLHVVYDLPRIPPYLESFAPDMQRSLLRLAIAVCLLLIVVLLRPNLRVLTARSLVLRMGRVERQTMLGLAASILVFITGDVIHIVAAELPRSAANALFLLGVLLISVGSMLLTVGIVGVVIDCFRIVPVVLHPPISPQQVLGEEAES